MSALVSSASRIVAPVAPHRGGLDRAGRLLVAQELLHELAHRHRRANGPAVGLEPEDQRVARLLGALLGLGVDGVEGAHRLAGDGVDVGEGHLPLVGVVAPAQPSAGVPEALHLRGLLPGPGFLSGLLPGTANETRPTKRKRAARPRRSKGASGGTPESRAAGAFSTPSFNRHCDRQFDRHLTDKTGLKGETKENEAGRRRREKTRIRSSAWCPQKPQTSQNFEKPQVKPLINERSLARQL